MSYQEILKSKVPGKVLAQRYMHSGNDLKKGEQGLWSLPLSTPLHTYRQD